MAFMLTIRGIPQIYYGTELLMDGDGNSHPNMRLDYPGEVNGFTDEGRSTEQKEAFNFLKTLLNWRKDNEVIHKGKLKHFIPEKNIYVYFRYLDERSVMVIINANDSEKILDTKSFNESLQEFKIGREVIMQQSIIDLRSITLPPWTVSI
ncbi:MAG: cyclomaltodextrinase C-terminal domain-containing protein [Cyclobacteriaceae bacterium]